MRTPREILLGRHKAVSPKLDAIRVGVLAGRDEHPARQALSWRDWFWPCPRAWAGLAAAWLIILGMNLAAGKNPSRPFSQTLVASRQLPMELQRQEQMLTSLIAPEETAEADQPKAVTTPRSDRRKTAIAV